MKVMHALDIDQKPPTVLFVALNVRQSEAAGQTILLRDDCGSGFARRLVTRGGKRLESVGLTVDTQVLPGLVNLWRCSPAVDILVHK